MKDIKKLLEIRNTLKKSKPNYLRQDAHKKKRIPQNWRKPRGLQSKMRCKLRGYRKSPEVGFGTPKAVWGFSREGLKPVMINTMSDVKKLTKDSIAVICSTMGTKKRIAVVAEIKKLGVKIQGINDPEKYLKSSQESFQKRKEDKKRKEDEKKDRTKKAEEKKNKKKDIEKEVKEAETDKDKKDVEKKEKDKMLISTA